MSPFWLRTSMFVSVLVIAAVAHGGVEWETSLEQGLNRAALEGRPVLFAINAKEGESANERLCHALYPSEAWGEATREYVCFVCNGGAHGHGGSPYCARYGEPLRCKDHLEPLRYVLRRFSPIERTMISPQHIVLEPDGGLAYRKEYYTGVVTPDLLERLFVRISPGLAYEAAGDARPEKIDALEKAPLASVATEARTWLRSNDLYAAAGVLRAIDYSFDDDRRLRLTQALDATPPAQLSVVLLFADEIGSRPDDRPKESLAFARALIDIDRNAGIRLLARMACHTTDSGLRKRALDVWLKDERGKRRKRADLPQSEKALLYEVELLTGSRSGTRVENEAHADRLARAEAKAGVRPRRYPPLAEALDDAPPGVLRGSLLEASRKEVAAHATAIRTLLHKRPEARVRAAAALALIGSGGRREHRALTDVLWEALADPVEGPETRREATRRLGIESEPGETYEAWADAVRAAGKGDR